MKSFKDDFNKLLIKLKNNEYFAFSRFSDGEMFILQNRSLKLDKTGTYIDNILVHHAYPENDWKEFDPEKHQFFREKLIKSYQFKYKNFYIATSCPCCVGNLSYQWLKSLRGENSLEDEQFTWANLFLNSNFPRFVTEFVPELEKRKIIFICNESADLSKAELNIIKDFRVGTNCLINNFDLYKDIEKWIIENDIKDHVFLFSASSLSNITIYELFQRYPDNFYLDIGTALSKQIGIPLARDYLKAYYSKTYHPDLFKTCVMY